MVESLSLPVTHYEISIYSGMSWTFWFLIFASMAIGLIVLFDTYLKGSSLWLISFILILFNIFILVILPYLRGYYYFGGEDSLVHMGTIRLIVEEGHMPIDSIAAFYPLMHYQGSFLQIILNLPLNTIPYLGIFLYILIYSLSYIILSRLLTPSNAGRGLIIVLGLLPIFGLDTMNYSPFVRAILLIPIIMYLFLKTRSNIHRLEFSLILLIVLLSLPLLHPLVSIFLFILILGLIISEQINIHLGLLPRLSIDQKSSNWTILMIVIISTFAWISQFLYFRYVANKIIDNIFYANGQSLAKTYTSITTIVQPLDLLYYILINYGSYIILSVISIHIFLYHIFPLASRRKSWNPILLSLFIIATIFFLLSSVLFILDFLVGPRTLSILGIILISICGLGFYYSRRRQRTLIVALLIILMLIPSISTFYSSPVSKGVGWHYTEMDLVGDQWAISSSESNYFLCNYRIWASSQYLGLNASIASTDIQPHFNFDELFENQDISHDLIIIDEKMKESYPTLFPNYESYWKYSKNDFDNLIRRGDLSRAYINGDKQIYLINMPV